jgi:hypothetical protein
VFDVCEQWSIDERFGFFAGRTALERQKERTRRRGVKQRATESNGQRRATGHASIKLLAARLAERLHMEGERLEVNTATIATEFGVTARIVWAACAALAEAGLADTEPGVGGNRILTKKETT